MCGNARRLTEVMDEDEDGLEGGADDPIIDTGRDRGRGGGTLTCVM